MAQRSKIAPDTQVHLDWHKGKFPDKKLSSKQHKALIKRSKKKGGRLTRKKRGGKWHHCKECPYKTTHASDLRRHLATHGGLRDRKYEVCYVPSCDFKTREKGNLKQHLANKHGIGVTWHECDLCDYKAKKGSDLKKHNAYRHDIGVVWHPCHLCEYRAKKKGTLNKHLKVIHKLSPEDIVFAGVPVDNPFDGMGFDFLKLDTKQPSLKRESSFQPLTGARAQGDSYSDDGDDMHAQMFSEVANPYCEECLNQNIFTLKSECFKKH
jgi:hypothetical protein